MSNFMHNSGEHNFFNSVKIFWTVPTDVLISVEVFLGFRMLGDTCPEATGARQQ